jgi:hypothetical protein
VIRNLEVIYLPTTQLFLPEAEPTFYKALDAVELASCDSRFRRTDGKHIFHIVITTFRIDVEEMQKYA